MTIRDTLVAMMPGALVAIPAIYILSRLGPLAEAIQNAITFSF